MLLGYLKVNHFTLELGFNPKDQTIVNLAFKRVSEERANFICSAKKEKTKRKKELWREATRKKRKKEEKSEMRRKKGKENREG